MDNVAPMEKTDTEKVGSDNDGEEDSGPGSESGSSAESESSTSQSEPSLSGSSCRSVSSDRSVAGGGYGSSRQSRKRHHHGGSSGRRRQWDKPGPFKKFKKSFKKSRKTVPEMMEIFTDGSVKRIGGKSRMGVGIVWARGNQRLSACAYKLTPLYREEYDNNLSEIWAAVLALVELATWDEYKGEKITLYTDSQTLFQYLDNGKNNEAMKEDADLLMTLAERFPFGVHFKWIRAHIDTDSHHAKADQMARRGAALPDNPRIKPDRGESGYDFIDVPGIRGDFGFDFWGQEAEDRNILPSEDALPFERALVNEE